MSSSERWVTVDSKDGCSELYLQNHNYDVVAAGVGRLDTHVAPGLYKLRQRIGDTEHSRVVEVFEDRSLHLTLDAIAFASPIPMAGSTTSHEFQQAALAATSPTTTTQGEGQLWLMVRDSRWRFAAPGPDLEQHWNAEIARLRIESLDGTYSAALAQIAETHRDAGFTRLSAALDPGAYLLVQQVDEQTQRCMPLIVLQRWALHVFIDIGGPTTETFAPLDLDRAALVYASPGRSLQPADPELMLLETARKAFARRRSSLAPDIVDRVLDGKFVNPMLGLLGAHLLLDLPDADADADRAGLVIDNTAALLGEDHPDIIALRMRLVAGAMAKPPRLTAPPMLIASWNALARLSADVPKSGLSGILWFPFTVAMTTTWFVWNEPVGVRASGVLPEVEGAVVSRGTRGPPLTGLVAQLLANDQLQAWLRDLKKMERKTGTPPEGLDLVDRSLLTTLASAQMSVTSGLTQVDSSIVGAVVRGLNLTPATSRRSITKLLTKLEEWQDQQRP